MNGYKILMANKMKVNFLTARHITRCSTAQRIKQACMLKSTHRQHQQLNLIQQYLQPLHIVNILLIITTTFIYFTLLKSLFDLI